MGIHGELLESERRLATVMFADISGFTAMSEQMDSEDVALTMNECFTSIGYVIEHYGGTIDKFIGDCIMVLYGLPAAIEDAPIRAVNAAIEIRRRISQFNSEKMPGMPLDIHIGINTGTMIAGAVGSSNKKQYTVIGDTVNVASGLKDLSGKGQIFVGPLTYEYTKNNFQYRELAPVFLKGRKDPVQAYELLTSRAKTQRRRPERMLHSSMVGRSEELAKLELHALKVINGEGSIVSIIGEAGIGKSRLFTELVGRDALKQVTILKGSAVSSGKNLSFYPIIELLKKWTGITEDDTEIASCHKLEQTVASVCPDDLSEIFPFVGTLMGMRLSGKDARRVYSIEGEALEMLIAKNLRDLFSKASQKKPIIFLTEDLHWADTSSIELIESLFKLVENCRIMFVNIFRPNYPETGERILRAADERYASRHLKIHLQPLDATQCKTLIENLLPIEGLPVKVRDLAISRAEGNPLFIEEVIQSFIDNKVVKIKDGSFEVTEKIETVVVPNTVRDLVMARIDKLEERTKSLLKFAAVIGKTFLYRILLEVAKSIDDIDIRLEHLKEVDLIRERSQTPEVEYVFRHALFQEITYEAILHKKREEIHIEIARTIESLFSERLQDFYGMLAYHYGKGKNREKTEEYLIKAGQEALKVSASHEALSYYQEALKLYLERDLDAVEGSKIAELEKSIALALFNRGQDALAVDHFDRALEYFRPRRMRNALKSNLLFVSDLINVIAHLYLPLRRSRKIPDRRETEIINLSEKRALALIHVDTRRFFKDTVGTLKKLNSFDITSVNNGVTIFIESSGVFSFSGVSFKLSRKILDRAKEYVRRDDIRAVFFYAFFELVHNFFSGNWSSVADYNDELVNSFLKTGQVYQAAAYTVTFALLRIEQGRFDEAALLCEKIRDIGEAYDHDYTKGAAYLIRTKLFLKSRRLHEALKEADVGISFLKKVNQSLYAWRVTGLKANIQFLLGDVEGMRGSLSQAKEFCFDEAGMAPFYVADFMISKFLYHINALGDATRTAGKKGDERLVSAAYKRGKELVGISMKYAADRPEAFRLMGNYHWVIGKQEKAFLWWRKSMKAGEQIGSLPELARTYFEIGRRLIETGGRVRESQQRTPEEYFEKAKSLFERLKLERDLKELEEVLLFSGE